jgi:hypothetical protein
MRRIDLFQLAIFLIGISLFLCGFALAWCAAQPLPF